MVLGEKFGRREFMIQSAAAAAFTIVPRHVLGGPGQTPPSGKLNIAGIGIGGQGASDLKQMETENIVALCDVDPGYAAPVLKRYPQAKFYTDFREMLATQKDIDAVMIATPDHTHAVIAMAAMKAGKHVYCEKPLCHDIYEARALARMAKEIKQITCMGIQGHSGEGIRLISEWIDAGLIGEVREVDAWCSLSYYPWGHTWWSSKLASRPAATEVVAVPEGLKWDQWLGPAKARPYHPTYHPRSWRAWWDFGNGMMGDRGAHTFDPIVTALKLGAPVSIEATSCGLNPDTHPVSAIVTFEFEGTAKRAPVRVTWYEGTRPPRPQELELGRELPKEGGAIFKGTKGKIMCGVYGESPRIIPETKMQSVKRPPKTLPRIPDGNHQQEWIRACKEGRSTGAQFGYAGALTEICLLGNIAKRADTKILWDSARMKITNLPEMNQYVRMPYREGWSL